jgi:hypothetical protein
MLLKNLPLTRRAWVCWIIAGPLSYTLLHFVRHDVFPVLPEGAVVIIVALASFPAACTGWILAIRAMRFGGEGYCGGAARFRGSTLAAMVLNGLLVLLWIIFAVIAIQA